MVCSGRARWMTLTLFVCAVLFPTITSALVKSSSFEVSGWIPYWRTATGTADALQHLDVFTEINPFVYTVKKDGTFKDNGNLSEEPWRSFIATAKAKKVRIIPTIMWSDGDTIHAILKNTKTRIAMEDRVAALVKENNFDGIDIDFEGKKAETKPYFSLFLKGLAQRLGSKKWLMCTIESRTPPNSRYDTIPKTLEYANDFVAINKYCDRVRIMAYDQQSIDIKLNRGEQAPYVPIADTRWVEKVIAYTAQTISKKKIVIGVPTYGYEYDVTQLTQGYRYDLLWAFNPRYATDLAASLGIVPLRNSAGELSFTYNATTTPVITAPPPSNGTSNNPSLSTTSTTGGTSATSTRVVFRILWWSDARAIADKIALAKRLGVRGIAIFKIDGGQDPNLWSVLSQ